MRNTIKPRKIPKFPRGHQTVSAITEAAAHLFIQRGYRRTTTNQIAEHAGVSIGSLYKYFPNKEAIAASLIEMRLGKEVELIESMFKRLSEAPAQAAFTEFIKGLVELNGKEPSLDKELLEQLSQVDRWKQMLSSKEHVIALFVRYFRSRQDLFRIDDVEMTSFILVNAIQGVIHSASHSKPGYFESKHFEELLTTLAMRFLRV